MKKGINRFISVFLAVTMLVSLNCGSAFAVNVIGNDAVVDIPGDGVGNYMVSTLAHLKALAAAVNRGETFQGANFRLQNDISFSSTSALPVMESWTPIGTKEHPFHGRFYGNGFTLSNLYISGDASYVGFFGYLDNTIVSDLTVTGSVSGGSYVGGIAGFAENVDFKNCKSSVSVSGSGTKIGGIAGAGTYFTDCVNSGTVVGGSRVGGIAGDIAGIEGFAFLGCTNIGNISGVDRIGGILGNGLSSSAVSAVSQCKNSGTIVGSGNYCGGILGYAMSCYVDCCQNLGAITAGNYAGGIAGVLSSGCFLNCCLSICETAPALAGGSVSGAEKGYIVGTSFISAKAVNNCFYTSPGNYIPTNTMGTKINDIGSPASYPGFDFKNIWVKPSADSAPTFIKDMSAAECPDSAVWDGSVATGFASGSGTAYDPFVINTAAQLAFLQYSVNTKRNTYFEKYIKLGADILLNDSSLTFWTRNAETSLPIGASAQTPFAGNFDGDGHTIKGLFVTASLKSNCSGLFGYCTGDIKNVNIAASYIEGAENTGAVVGVAKTIAGCRVDAATVVDAIGSNVGGIVGTATAVSLCKNRAAVFGASKVGGIVGMINFGSSLSLCENRGSVLADSFVGGIVGSASYCDSFENCFNTADIVAVNYAGGIIGFGEAMTSRCCYSVGGGNEAVDFGGIGGNDGFVAENCFYLSSAFSSAPTSPKGVALSSAQLAEASSYTGFDFETIWAFGLENDYSYPTLSSLSETVIIGGNISVSGSVKFGTAASINSSGILPSGAVYSVEWLLNGTVIEGAVGKSYTPVAADVGKYLSVRVKGTGDFVGTLVSAPVLVERAAAAAVPEAPTLEIKTDTIIVLVAVDGCEYRCGNGSWQQNSTFNNLAPNTVYNLYVRYAQTATNFASAASAALSVTTDRSHREAPKAPVVQSKTASSVTLVPISGCEYRCGDGAWQSANTFTQLEKDTDYTFFARYSMTDSYYASPVSFGTTVRTDAIPVESVSMDRQAVTIDYRSNDTVLAAIVLPANASNKEVVWESSNPKIVSVDNGRLTGCNRGTAVITATTVDGKLVAKCQVTVQILWWQWLVKIFLLGFLWY